MSDKTCDAILVSCIDFRIQDFLNQFGHNNLGDYNFDRLLFPGGGKDFHHIMEQVYLSKKLHDIKRVVIVNHEDCGAYGEEGSEQVIKQDLIDAKDKIRALSDDLAVETYYLRLDGTFEEV